MKKTLTLIFVLLCETQCLAMNATIIKGAADYIVSCFYENAIALTPDPPEDVMPYFGHFAAIGLALASKVLEDNKYVDHSWTWLHWYKDHMQSDTGFVDDYNRDGYSSDPWEDTGDMDSTDSYAAMFMVALYYSYVSDSNITKIREFSDAIPLAVTAIEQTLDTDGLTWAKPDWYEKYVMDAVETVAGLRACVQLAPLLEDTSLQSRCQNLADEIGNATLDHLWVSSDDGWGVYIDEAEDPFIANWTILYDDAECQMWPAAFALLPASDSRAGTDIADRFLQLHPQWCQPLQNDWIRVEDDIPSWEEVGWEFTPVGWGLLHLGKTTEAAAAVPQLWNAALATDMQYPFHSGCAGELIFLDVAQPLAFPSLDYSDGSHSNTITSSSHVLASENSDNSASINSESFPSSWMQSSSEAEVNLAVSMKVVALQLLSVLSISFLC